MYQWNRIDSLEIDPHKCKLAIIGRPMEKRYFFSTNGTGAARYSHAKKKVSIFTDLLYFT